MPDKHIRILLIEDNPGDARLIREMLADATGTTYARLDVECADTLQAGVEHLAEGGIDIVLLDLGLPDSQGLATLTKVSAGALGVPIVVLTGLADEMLGIKAVQEGAQDYVVKGQVDGPSLARFLRYAIERKQAQEEIRKRKEYLETIMDSSLDLIFTVKKDGAFGYANPRLEEILGYKFEDVKDRNFLGFVPQEMQAFMLERRQEIQEGTGDVYETKMVKRDGSVIDCLVSHSALKGVGEHLAILKDITERKRAEERIRRLNRVYSVLSDINQTVVRVEDRQELFDETCRIAVEKGLFRMAWIGMVDDEEFLEPVASFGCDEGYLTETRISVGAGRGPMGKAIRKGEHFICNDIQHDRRKLPWREEAMKRGYRSCASFPLRIGTDVVGLFNVLAEEARFFDEQEIQLFDEAATDISFALQTFEVEEQRRRAEDAVQESEERFRRLSEAAFEGIVIHDKGKILDANQTLAAMFGRKLSEMIGMDGLGLIAPEFRDLVAENIRSGYEKPYEAVCIRKDGSAFPVEICARNTVYQNQKVRVAAMRDITERKAAERALKASEENYRTIFDAANDAIFVHDLETGEVLEVNQTMCEMYGYTREEARDVSIEALSSGEPSYTRKDARRWMKKAAEEGPQLFEWQAKGKDGRLFWVEVNLKRGVVGGKDRLLAAVRDITERKWAEEVLQRSEERYRTMIENSNDLIWTLDREGNFTWVNRKAEEVSGHKLEDWVGKSFAPMIPPDDLPRLTKIVLETLEGKAQTYEADVFRADGSIFSMSVNTAPMYDSGEIVGVVNFGRDITEQKLAEEELRFKSGLLDNATDSVFVHDFEGNMLYVNEAAHKTRGYTREELLSLPLAKLDVPEYAVLIQPRMEELVRTGRAVLESAHFKKDGSVMDVEVHARIIEFEGRKLIASVVRDISERKRAEEALRESEDKYRTIFETTGAATAIIEEDTIMSLVNAEFAKLAGCSTEEIEGKRSWTEFVAKDDLERMKENHRLRRVDPHAAPKSYEFKFIDCQGNVKHVFLVADMIPGTKKSVASLIDISERKRAEEAVRESEEKYRILVETANDAIFIADAETGIILDANKKAGELLGIPVEKIIGMHQTQVHPKEEAERYAKIFRNHVRSGIAISEDLFVVRKDGRRVSVEISASVAQVGGRRVNQGIFRDVTRRREMEGKLQHYGEQMRKIGEIARELSSELSVERLLPKIAKRAAELVDGDGAAIGFKVGEDIVYPYLYKVPTDLKRLVVKKGGGLAGHVINTGESLILHDYPTHPRAVPEFVDAGLKTLAAVPLTVGKRTLGALGVFGFSHDRRFTDEQLALLDAVAKTSAVAMQNAESYERVRRQEREKAALYEASKLLVSNLQLDKVLSEVSKSACRILGAKVALISLIGGDRLYMAGSYGIAEEFAPHVRVKMGEGVCGEVARDGRLRQCSDLQSHSSDICRKAAKSLGMHSVLSVPLQVRKRVLGVLNVYSHVPRHFTDDETRLALTFVRQAAIAIENAQMYEDLQRKQVLQQELLRKIVSSEEDERNRVAAAIHDDMLQSIIASFYHIQAFQTEVNDESLRKKILKAEALLNDSIVSARRLIFDLRPPLLQELGFVPALRKMLKRFKKRSGMGAKLVARRVPRMAQAVETALYRVVQEALVNAEKHARAKNVLISITRVGDRLEVRVKDDGLGFDKSLKKADLHHFGMQLMRERAVLCGGTLDVNTQPGRGTEIRVSVPLSVALDTTDETP